MPHKFIVRPLLYLLAAVLSLPAIAAAQSPIGHWAIEHPGGNGIGEWFDFRPDGTFSVFQGAMVTTAITRAGDTFTLPPTTAGGPPAKIKFHVEGEVLHLVSPTGADVTYSRVGTAPTPSDPLLGKWKPTPPKTPSTDPKTAATERRNTLALYVFGADNTEAVRIPFSARRGTWDDKKMTYQFQGDPNTYSLQLAYGKLLVGQPPDSKKTETYITDPILP